MAGTITRVLDGIGLRTWPVVPTPTKDDVEWYIDRRAIAGEIQEEILDAAPRRALQEAAAAIGDCDAMILLNPEGQVTPELACCIFNWTEDGRNLVQRYAEDFPHPDDSEERDVLDSLLRARYTVLSVEEHEPGIGVHARDMLTRDELFLMDVSLSLDPMASDVALAGHIMPIGEYWMTTGGAIPLAKQQAREALKEVERADEARAADGRSLFERPGNVEAFIRAADADEARFAVTYRDAGEPFHVAVEEMMLRKVAAWISSMREEAEAAEEFPVIVPEIATVPAAHRRVARNGPCTCGSGRKFKRCCGRAGAGRQTA